MPHPVSPSPHPYPHVEEQHALRSETIAVFHNAGKGAMTTTFSFLEEKTTDEIEQSGEEYRDFGQGSWDDLEGLITIEKDVDWFYGGEMSEVQQRKARSRRIRDQEGNPGDRFRSF